VPEGAEQDLAEAQRAINPVIDQKADGKIGLLTPGSVGIDGVEIGGDLDINLQPLITAGEDIKKGFDSPGNKLKKAFHIK
jgi:hypothetical protein